MNRIVLDTDLIPLLPQWYREVLDYQEICNTEKDQLDLLASEIMAVANNMFFQTMEVEAIEDWERLLNIAPTAAETLTFRRDRVLNRVSAKPPFTLRFLYKKLDELIGEGQWNVYVDYPNYTLYVESSAQNQFYAQEVSFLINKIKPAHIVYVNTPLLPNTIKLSEGISSTSYTYNYALGSFGLGLLPFASMGEERQNKMPTTESLQPALLNYVSSSISTDVAAARLNSSIVISSLNKTVTDNVLTITYSVIAEQTTSITKIELLDSNNNVLTESAVYIPISEPTTIKHIITSVEGV